MVKLTLTSSLLVAALTLGSSSSLAAPMPLAAPENDASVAEIDPEAKMSKKDADKLKQLLPEQPDVKSKMIAPPKRDGESLAASIVSQPLILRPLLCSQVVFLD